LFSLPSQFGVILLSIDDIETYPKPNGRGQEHRRRRGRQRPVLAQPAACAQTERLGISADWLIRKPTLDVLAQSQARVVPILPVRGHGLEANRFERPVYRGLDLSGWRKITLDDVVDQGAQIAPRIRRLAGEERIQGRSQAIDIGG